MNSRVWSSSLLPVALRAYAVQRDAELRRSKKNASKATKQSARKLQMWLNPSTELVIDTETTIDRSQRLLFGCWRVLVNRRTVDEGLFYADDLLARDYEILQAYVKSHQADTVGRTSEPLRLLSWREFLRFVFWKIAYKGRGLVVCFNLPFDLSRIASKWGIARTPPYTRGFSLVLGCYLDTDGRWCENSYRPRMAIKNIDSKRSLKGFTRPRAPDLRDLIPEGGSDGRADRSYTFRGNFLDLRTFVFALTNKSHSLASACKAFGVEHGKEEAKEHGKVTPEYIDYCRRDVLSTTELYLKLAEGYTRHPINLSMTQAYSPASITKAYLKAMGVQPVLERQPDFPKEVLGAGMEAYFGGRAECRIRRVPIRVVYLDFLSMYPTVCALTRLWDLYIAHYIEVVEATTEVETLLAKLTLDQCFQRDFWLQLVGLVQIQPHEDVVPVRARYEGPQSWQIGINPYSSTEPEWRTIADVVASTLLTGRSPKIVRAIRLVPQGVLPGLQPIQLRGAVPFDPTKQDFFAAIIEERKGLKHRTDLLPEERQRLDAFFKVLANAIYGINAEMNRQDLPAGDTADVEVYTGRMDPFSARVAGPEEPGAYCFPPLAACIAGAARLMLALLEKCVTDAGGMYALCDTDSMAIVATEAGGLVPCPGGSERLRGRKPAIQALSWAQVESIRQRFISLNPYDREVIRGSILKLEDENLDDQQHQRQLWACAISAKRYALFTKDESGRPVICKPSEHGLGHLLNPTDPDDESRDWIGQLWEGMITEALGLEYRWPTWLDRPALSRISISSPEYLKPFSKLNHGKPYAEQIKPFNFLLSAQVAPFGFPAGVGPEHFHLVAPYEVDPRKWYTLRWVDRYSGISYPITTSDAATLYGNRIVRIRTYGEILAEYRSHPEAKSLDPTGEVCDRQSMGLLRRRPVTRSSRSYVGKESNKLEEVEAGLVHDPDEVYTEYADPDQDPWKVLVVPVLKQMPLRLIQYQTGMSRSQIKAIRNGHAMPHLAYRKKLLALVAVYACKHAKSKNATTPGGAFEACAAYLTKHTTDPRLASTDL